jgi:hypothetical protein
MAVIYDVFVNDMKEIYSDDQGRKIFEFSIYNDFGSNITVNYTLDFGDGTNFTSSNINMSPVFSNDTLVYAEHVYPSEGNFTVSASIQSSQGTVANQSIEINVNKPNLRVSNLSVLNSTELRRVFEFRLQNNASITYTNITWQLNITSNSPINSTDTITLASNETMFVYVDYTYGQAGSHNITAIADYQNIHSESDENDNNMTITD